MTVGEPLQLESVSLLIPSLLPQLALVVVLLVGPYLSISLVNLRSKSLVGLVKVSLFQLVLRQAFSLELVRLQAFSFQRGLLLPFLEVRTRLEKLWIIFFSWGTLLLELGRQVLGCSRQRQFLVIP